MHNAAINILLNVFWCTRASFSRRSQSRSVFTSSQNLHIFNFTGVAKLLCRTAAAIYIPTSNVLTCLTAYSCQPLVLSDFKCLPFWWVCEVFTVICVSPLTTVTLSLFVCFCFALLCCSFRWVFFWHLDFLFCEVPVHAFCSFFYLVDCHVGQFPRSLALMLLTCHFACCQQAATTPS